jgi:hypothetical protein
LEALVKWVAEILDRFRFWDLEHDDSRRILAGLIADEVPRDVVERAIRSAAGAVLIQRIVPNAAAIAAEIAKNAAHTVGMMLVVDGVDPMETLNIPEEISG